MTQSSVIHRVGGDVRYKGMPVRFLTGAKQPKTKKYLYTIGWGRGSGGSTSDFICKHIQACVSYVIPFAFMGCDPGVGTYEVPEFVPVRKYPMR